MPCLQASSGILRSACGKLLRIILFSSCQIHKQKLDELQKRQKVLYEQQGNTLAVAYWINQFHDATDDRDGSIMKTLVEAIIVWDDRIEVRFKCGATVEQKYVE